MSLSEIPCPSTTRLIQALDLERHLRAPVVISPAVPTGVILVKAPSGGYRTLLTLPDEVEVAAPLGPPTPHPTPGEAMRSGDD